jgi:small-conductance mechanosensitive channel
MTRLVALQKGNQALRDEVAELKANLLIVSEDLSSKSKSKAKKQHGRQTEKKIISPERARSVEFISSQYDELSQFKETAKRQIQDIHTRVNKISERCDLIAKTVEESEAYSYQLKLWEYQK